MDKGPLALRRAVEALPEGTSITLRREALLQALGDDGDGSAAPPTDRPDRLLTAREVAERLGVTPKYVYAHHGELPFARRLPGRKALRFSERGLERWLAQARR